MDSRVVAQMAIFFGPMFGLALVLGLANVRLYADVRLGLTGIVTATISAFSLYRMTFAVLWNRRAARLRALRPERVDR